MSSSNGSKKTAGRPRLCEEKPVRVQVVLTAADAARVARQAKKAGIAVSAWCRGVIQSALAG